MIDLRVGLQRTHAIGKHVLIEKLQERVTIENHRKVNGVRVRQQNQPVAALQRLDQPGRYQSLRIKDRAPYLAKLRVFDLQLEGAAKFVDKHLRLYLAAFKTCDDVAGAKPLWYLLGRIVAERRHAVVSTLEIERNYDF